MTARISASSTLATFLANLPASIDAKIARPALLAGVDVIAEAARELCPSDQVRATIKTSSTAKDHIVTAKVKTQGPGAFKAPWLEHGTDPHFISVEGADGEGRTVKRLNAQLRHGSLVINGNFVGQTVHHPGARAEPFMRPAADTRERAAIDAIAADMRTRLGSDGLTGPAPALADDDE